MGGRRFGVGVGGREGRFGIRRGMWLDRGRVRVGRFEDLPGT